MKASVYIGVLTGGQIRAELAAALISMSHDGRYRTEIDFIWDRPIPSIAAGLAGRRWSGEPTIF